PPRTNSKDAARWSARAHCDKRARNLAAAQGAVKTRALLARDARRAHDLPERRGLERGAADERAVHVPLGEQRRGVAGIDAAAVEDRGRLARTRAEHAVERGA